MLKVRLMGTKNDIKWFGKILQRNPKIKVIIVCRSYNRKIYVDLYTLYLYESRCGIL